METGAFLNKGKPYSANSIKNWKKFAKVWQKFEDSENHHNLRFCNVDMRTYSEFMGFCDKSGYRLSTKYQYATLLKGVMNSAIEDGISTNTIQHRSSFATRGGNGDDTPKVYLTMDEITAISKLELEKDSTLSKVRDIFLVGCFTGQRVSDYKHLKSDDILPIYINKKKYEAFRMKQRKTGTTVLIPIFDNHVKEILSRWKGQLPDLAVSTINKEIKHICQMAGIDELIPVSFIQGGKQYHTVEKKYKLVSSHTARRSLITNLYLSGKLTTAQIRSISGHKTELSFNRYLCQDSEEDVKSIFKSLCEGK